MTMRIEMGGAADNEVVQRLAKDWKGYEENMKRQISSVMENQQKLYDTLSLRWDENSRNMRTQFLSILNGGTAEGRELYNLMRNYQNKLNARIMKAADIETTGYSELLEKWNGETSKVDGLFARLQENGQESKDDLTLSELYSEWMNLSNDMTRQFAKAIREGNGEYEKLNETWREFMDGMQDIISKMPRTNPMYDELIKAWEEMVRRMGEDITRLMAQGNSNFQTVRSTWETATEGMWKEMRALIKEFDYEALYLGFLNRANQGMGMNWPVTYDLAEYKRVERELGELKAMVRALEKKIRPKEE